MEDEEEYNLCYVMADGSLPALPRRGIIVINAEIMPLKLFTPLC